MNTPSPCPVQQLVDHSAEHFRPAANPETFEQLAERRAGNVELVNRFIGRLACIAPSPDDEEILRLAQIRLSDIALVLRSFSHRLNSEPKEVS